MGSELRPLSTLALKGAVERVAGRYRYLVSPGVAPVLREMGLEP